MCYGCLLAWPLWTFSFDDFCNCHPTLALKMVTVVPRTQCTRLSLFSAALKMVLKKILNDYACLRKKKGERLLHQGVL